MYRIKAGALFIALKLLPGAGLKQVFSLLDGIGVALSADAGAKDDER